VSDTGTKGVRRPLGQRLEGIWYGRSPASLPLVPFGWLFRALVGVRRLAFRVGLLRSVQLPVPVIVVGNITVGGSGKTPLVVWLAERLTGAGMRPGIISRGYGGVAGKGPRRVAADSDPMQVGDEPLLLARRTGCPVWVAPDRVAAGREAVAAGCDVIIADDGMQHYRLARRIEIAVLDGDRGLGNGRLLPAGPLREPASRLRQVDFIVNNGAGRGDEVPMRLAASTAHRLDDAEVRLLSSFQGQSVHAVAGIGHPLRFFRTLRERGVEGIPHPFPDHHRFQAADLEFGDGAPVLMTEKDAVKCRAFAGRNHWFVPVTAELPAGFGEQVLARIRSTEN